MKEKSKRQIILIILFFILLITTTSINNPINNDTQTIRSYQPDKTIKLSATSPPIHINNNWTAAVGAGIATGSGTYSDPYIIEDLVIDGEGTGTCIDIINSDVYFIIQNCTLYNAGVGIGPFYHAGIRFYDVSNGTLINNTVSNNGWSGIRMYYDCDNNTIIGNIANSNPDVGVVLLDGCDDNKVINNTFNDNGQWGIELYINSDNNNITRNIVKSNDKVGIQIDSACDNNLIYNNSLIDNIQSNAKDDGINNQWDNGSLGNYWSDYEGMDIDNDGIGDFHIIFLVQRGVKIIIQFGRTIPMMNYG